MGSKEVRMQISLNEYLKGNIPTIHDINRWGETQISIEEYMCMVNPKKSPQVSIDEFFEGNIPMIHDINTFSNDRQVSIEEACGPLTYISVSTDTTVKGRFRARKYNRTIRPITKNR